MPGFSLPRHSALSVLAARSCAAYLGAVSFRCSQAVSVSAPCCLFHFRRAVNINLFRWASVERSKSLWGFGEASYRCTNKRLARNLAVLPDFDRYRQMRETAQKVGWPHLIDPDRTYDLGGRLTPHSARRRAANFMCFPSISKRPWRRFPRSCSHSRMPSPPS